MASSDVEVTPPDLKFRFQINKQLFSAININNKSDQRQAFKIKTTAPKKYVVRPSSGVVDPKASLAVQVIMQAQKEYLSDYSNCKDKFMVQTTALSADEQIDKDTFSKEARKDLREARLRVVMEGPPAPPSPVPEANEHDADVRSISAAPASAAATAASNEVTRSAPMAAVAVGRGDGEATALKAQLDNLTKERDDLRKKLDYVELQGSATHKAAPAKDPAMQFRVTIIHIILVAIIAFLIGHYL